MTQTKGERTRAAILDEALKIVSKAGLEGLTIGTLAEATALSKSGLLAHAGTVSLETPVLYFYTDRETKASVKVDFPKGWVTEWYPYGELAFDPCYAGNPLVNALCLGVMRHEDLKLAAATGPGNAVVLVGAKTGPDGIGGASVLASASFGGGAEGSKDTAT